MKVFAGLLLFTVSALSASAGTKEVTGSQALLGTPCRVAVSSYSGWLNGPLTTGSEFHVAVRGTGSSAPGPSQGGASGCGVPDNVTAVSPVSAGSMTAGPYNDLPSVSVVTYTGTTTTQAWLILADPGHDLGFTVTSTVGLMVDVVGYIQ